MPKSSRSRPLEPPLSATVTIAETLTPVWPASPLSNTGKPVPPPMPTMRNISATLPEEHDSGRAEQDSYIPGQGPVLCVVNVILQLFIRIFYRGAIAIFDLRPPCDTGLHINASGRRKGFLCSVVRQNKAARGAVLPNSFHREAR